MTLKELFLSNDPKERDRGRTIFRHHLLDFWHGDGGASGFFAMHGIKDGAARRLIFGDGGEHARAAINLLDAVEAGIEKDLAERAKAS